MPNIGDIYSVEIFYDDNPSESKIRPVLVIDVEDNICLFVEITTTSPKTPPTYYDQFKEPPLPCNK